MLFRLANLLCFGKLRNRCYTDADSLALINTLACEAHRELYAAALNSRIQGSQGRHRNG